MTSLTGLENLTSVGGALRIGRNRALTDFTGLENLTSVGGSFFFIDNAALTNLTGLNGLTSVGGHIWISSNDALTDLTGLENITSVGDFLWIYENDALTSLNGLENLTAIDRDLHIQYNAALTNVDGLANLASVGRNLDMQGNPNLAECTVGLASFLLEGDIGGYVYIADNAPGCNSYWEAMGGAVDAEEEATPLVTGLAAPFPNPSAGAATLAFTLAEPADVRLVVYDALGRRVATLAEGPHAAGVHEAAWGAGLPAGTYVVRLTVGAETWTERVTLVR